MTTKALLLVPGFHTSNPGLWESHLQNFVPVSNFSKHLYQINLSLWESPNSGHKGKTCYSSGHMMGSNYCGDSP